MDRSLPHMPGERHPQRFGQDGQTAAAGPNPDDLVRLTDEEKSVMFPELGRRAATLHALVDNGMIRDPRNDREGELRARLDEWFPDLAPPSSATLARTAGVPQ